MMTQFTDANKLQGSSMRTKWLWVVQLVYQIGLSSWWRHQMETFSALLAICTGNSPVPGEFPAQRPVTRSFDVFFDLRSNKRLSKQWRGWWFETQSCPLWRHRNVMHVDSFVLVYSYCKDEVIFTAKPFQFPLDIDTKIASPWFNRV